MKLSRERERSEHVTNIRAGTTHVRREWPYHQFTACGLYTGREDRWFSGADWLGAVKCKRCFSRKERSSCSQTP